MIYTANEVARTAHHYVETNSMSLGAGLPHGINQVCRCCKAGSLMDGKIVGHVDRIIDQVSLKPWTDFFKVNEFAAYECGGCGYKFSWYRPKERGAN